MTHTVEEGPSGQTKGLQEVVLFFISNRQYVLFFISSYKVVLWRCYGVQSTDNFFLINASIHKVNINM